MLRKIKSWDEASRTVNAGNNESYYVYNDSIFVINKNVGSWGSTVGGYEEDGLFCADDGFAYPACVTEECDENDTLSYLLRWGKIVTDDEMFIDTHRYVRIRLIACNGELYYHKIVSGEVVECKIVGKTNDDE